MALSVTNLCPEICISAQPYSQQCTSTLIVLDYYMYATISIVSEWKPKKHANSDLSFNFSVPWARCRYIKANMRCLNRSMDLRSKISSESWMRNRIFLWFTLKLVGLKFIYHDLVLRSTNKNRFCRRRVPLLSMSSVHVKSLINAVALLRLW